MSEDDIELALVLDLLDHAANFMIGIGGIGGEDLGLARVHFLFRNPGESRPAVAGLTEMRPVRPATE